jgi:hypothetical protein
LPHISNNFGPLYFCKIRRISWKIKLKLNEL